MNLVKMLEEQLSGDVLDKLSGKIGADPESTGRAASAAVPALLAGLTKLASSDEGIRKLTGVLGNFDTGAFGNIAQALGGDSSALLNKGTSVLGTLFGGSILNNIASAIARYAGIDPAIVQKLLAFVAPMVLGKVASQWRAQGGTPSALSNLLSDQARYIPDSLPAGFSLDQVPGLSGAADTVRAASHSTRHAAETAARSAPSMASWLLPLAAIAVCGFLLWQFLKARPDAAPVAAQNASKDAETVTVMRPAVPDVPDVPNLSEATEQISSMFKTLGETLAGITDAASAERALPALEELNGKIDSMKMALAKLPQAGRAALQKTIDESLAPIKQQTERALAVPGLSEQIRMLIGQIVRKLEEWKIIEAAA